MHCVPWGTMRARGHLLKGGEAIGGIAIINMTWQFSRMSGLSVAVLAASEYCDAIGTCHHPNGILKGLFGCGAGRGAGGDGLRLGDFDCAFEAELLDLVRPPRGVPSDPPATGVPRRLSTVVDRGEAAKERLIAEAGRL